MKDRDKAHIQRRIFCLGDGHVFSPLRSHIGENSPACACVHMTQGNGVRYVVGTLSTVTRELETGKIADPPCRWTRSRSLAADWLHADFCKAWCAMVGQVMSAPPHEG